MGKPGFWLYWRQLFPRVFRLLASDRIPLWEKGLFVIPVALYCVLPDVLPLVPIDDVAVTVMATAWFAARMERKYEIAGKE